MRSYDDDVPEDIPGTEEGLVKIDTLQLKKLDGLIRKERLSDDKARLIAVQVRAAFNASVEEVDRDMKEYDVILKDALAANRLSPPTGTIASMQEALENVRPVACKYEYIINSSDEVRPGTVRITITEPDLDYKPRNMYYPKLSDIIIILCFMIGVVLTTIFL